MIQGDRNVLIGAGVTQGTASDTLLIGSGTDHLVVGTFGTPANASFTMNAGHIEIDVASMPTSYDSANRNRVWLDGAGTASGNDKGGVLRIGPVNDGSVANTMNSQL